MVIAQNYSGFRVFLGVPLSEDTSHYSAIISIKILAKVTNLLLLPTLMSLMFFCSPLLLIRDVSVMSRTSQKRSEAQNSN